MNASAEVVVERSLSEPVASKSRRPPIRPRLIAGLLYLQHAFDLSDEEVVTMWIENPYWQVFTGETYLQTAPPIDPSMIAAGNSSEVMLRCTSCAARQG